MASHSEAACRELWRLNLVFRMCHRVTASKHATYLLEVQVQAANQFVPSLLDRLQASHMTAAVQEYIEVCVSESHDCSCISCC